MKLQIKIFGRLAELTGSSTMEMDNVKDTDDLYEILYQHHPVLKEVKFFIAINNRVINSNTSIDEHSTVALLPPFSGG